ncbi:MAG: DUF3467 domain-containing protein [Actinobacteria bacterium]|nr:DUF3467 domain-containing protein [Actinomycetota bacterium]
MAELSPQTQLIYANWVRTNASPFDVALDFGYSPEQGPPDSIPVRVVMSWEEAKALVALLSENMADYEEQAGPIRKLFATQSEENAGDDPQN